MPRSDNPTIVLLPGLDGSGRLFWRLREELERQHQVEIVAYPADRPQTYAELADQVALSIGERTVILLGESFSGPIAIEVAARLSQQVAGLVLAGTFATAPVPPLMLRIGARIDPRFLPRAFIYLIMRGRAADPELARELEAQIAGLRPEVLAMRLRELAEVDKRDQLRRVACPLLVLHGSDDWLVWRISLREILRIKPEATARLLPGPHMLLQRAPGEAAREIAAFMQRCRLQAISS